MPYIPKSQKQKADDGIIKDCGYLNYSIHQLIDRYMEINKESYQTYNDIIGALDCAKMEIYRRLVSKYEDRKILQNGDVAPYSNETEA